MIGDAARRIVEAGARVTLRRPPSAAAPLAGEPADLAALYAVSDGIELADGTRVLPRGEIAAATAWLVGEKSLGWGPDLWVIGERDDLVIVRDLDAAGARAGGGVLETPTDGLTVLRRAALDVIGYLQDRLGVASPPYAVSPERRAREAAARGDAQALEEAIACGFYPGAERDLAHAALSLGAIRAGAGDAAGAMEAFERAVAVRVQAAPRGAEAIEARAAWRACAVAAEKTGARDVADRCRAAAR
jgi:hypothetical protein